jgi:mRNA-degrading endonuclease toxin of MazEF toxin-antitoxin module
LKRGEVWWADLGPYRPREQTGRRPVVIWQSDTLTRVLQLILVVPLTTNRARASVAATAVIAASSAGPPEDSVTLAFQIEQSRDRLYARRSGTSRMARLAELELTTDEVLGSVEPQQQDS